MRIIIDYEGITYASDHIRKLKDTAFEINDCLMESLGEANAEEKEVIRLLSEICTVTFPEMLESTCRLLQAIATDFRNMDENFGGLKNPFRTAFETTKETPLHDELIVTRLPHLKPESSSGNSSAGTVAQTIVEKVKAAAFVPDPSKSAGK